MIITKEELAIIYVLIEFYIKNKPCSDSLDGFREKVLAMIAEDESHG